MHFIQDLKNFIPLIEQEFSDKALMLDAALRDPEHILTRDMALMHMTASSIIVNKAHTHTLMAYHNIYASWAWTGGHADGEGDLLKVALKEAGEETGIKTLEPIKTAPISLEILSVPSHIKRGKYVSTHLHFNLTYALEGNDGETLTVKPDENARVGWLPINELDSFVSEKAMLPIYKKILDRIV